MLQQFSTRYQQEMPSMRSPKILYMPTFKTDSNGAKLRIAWPWRIMEIGDVYHIVSRNSYVRNTVTTSAGSHKRSDAPFFKLRAKTVHGRNGSDPYVMVRAIDLRIETPDMTARFNLDQDRRTWAETSDSYATGITEEPT